MQTPADTTPKDRVRANSFIILPNAAGQVRHRAQLGTGVMRKVARDRAGCRLCILLQQERRRAVFDMDNKDLLS